MLDYRKTAPTRFQVDQKFLILFIGFTLEGFVCEHHEIRVTLSITGAQLRCRFQPISSMRVCFAQYFGEIRGRLLSCSIFQHVCGPVMGSGFKIVSRLQFVIFKEPSQAEFEYFEELTGVEWKLTSPICGLVVNCEWMCPYMINTC